MFSRVYSPNGVHNHLSSRTGTQDRWADSRRWCWGVVTGILLLVEALPGCAATLTVANTNDSGSGSLRAVIASASPGDMIQFSVTGTIRLTSGDIVITKDLTIVGPGASQLAISGNKTSRVFDIAAGEPLTLSGLTIENGHAISNNGGGIINQGTLRVTNSTFSGNSADAFGGGILNSGGTLTVTNSTFSGNSAGNTGGGIGNLGGLVTVTNSTFSGNSAGIAGGGLGVAYAPPHHGDKQHCCR